MRICAYADLPLVVGADEIPPRASMSSKTISTLVQDPLHAGDYTVVQVACVNPDDMEPTWELFQVMFKDVPKFLVRYFKRMRLHKPIKTVLQYRYGMEKSNYALR